MVNEPSSQPAPNSDLPPPPESSPDAKPRRKRISKDELQRAGKLLRYIRPYRGRFIAAMVALALASMFALALPELIKMLIDVANGRVEGNIYRLPEGLRNINGIAGLIIAVLVAQSTISFFRVVWFSEVGERAIGAMRKDVYGRMITLPMTFFGQRRVGELTSRLSADITQIQETLIREVPQMLRQGTIAIGGIILVVVFFGKLALMMLATFPITVAVTMLLGRRVRSISRQAQDQLAESNIVAEETLQAIQAVKAFTNEPYEQGRYGSAIGQFVDLAVRGAKMRAGLISFIIFGLFGSIILVIWFGAGMVQRGEMTLGALTQFVIYTVFIGSGLRTLGEFYANLQKTLGATERVEELLGETVEDSAQATTPPERLRGQVEYRDVSFHYPGRADNPVLRGINITAEPGQRVALVGPSGAGKSTIAGLLFRFYDPQEGGLWVDGIPISEYPLASLRGQMALVPQDVTLFGGSIRDNIAYGRPQATDAEVHEAARLAYAHDFIMSFPEGYATLVGERGIKLSGGQRQRIAIARAILRDPAILVLDEATSSLDSESERLVQAALETLLEGRTSIIIAHRLSTIRRSHKIVVISEGRVVEEGRHEELMAQEDGVYRNLSDLQLEIETER